MYCLEVLLMKLKPKGVKDPVKSRMKAIINFADVSFCIFSLLVYYAAKNFFPPNHRVLKMVLLKQKKTMIHLF